MMNIWYRVNTFSFAISVIMCMVMLVEGTSRQDETDVSQEKLLHRSESFIFFRHSNEIPESFCKFIRSFSAVIDPCDANSAIRERKALIMFPRCWILFYVQKNIVRKNKLFWLLRDGREMLCYAQQPGFRHFFCFYHHPHSFFVQFR